ncbi:MAG: N-acetylneuraminate synthase family protein, partial [Candidatus Omnitrophica bacterium]|nr:N-acetylneuraminate synthase family protein [Candidatus Omnitrophota bacterium]
MIIVMKPKATKQQIDHVVEKIKALGLKPMVSKGTERTIIGVIGSEDAVRVQPLEIFAGVEQVIPVLKPFKLVSREFRPQDSVVDVHGVKIGGRQLVMMAGPCSVENRAMLMASAKAAERAGAQVLRGGAFKPRTSPYSFQGLGEEGLRYLREAADEHGLKVVTEVMDVRDVPVVSKYADIVQIGARNMQNFNLLTEVGQAHKPVLLKRGLSATITEFLLAAEYILSQGNFNV